MKNTIRLKAILKIAGIIAIGAVIIFTMAACGGGGSGAKKSGLKTDGFFGALPAIYADHNLADDAVREKNKIAKEKAEKKQDAKAYAKAGEQFSKGLEEIGDKLTANVDAEVAKLVGKDVPFTVAENFRTFKVNSLKVDASGNLVMETSDVRRNMMGVAQFTFRAVAKDGSVIIEHVNYGADKVIVSGSMRSEPEKWVDFEKIEFIGS